jgi:hypothetical protein
MYYFLWRILKKIDSFHLYMMEEKKITDKQFERIRKTTIMENMNGIIYDFSIKSITKDIYQTLFYIIRNTCYLCMMDRKKNEENWKKIQDIQEENEIISLECKLKKTFRNFDEVDKTIHSHPKMSEIITKSDKVILKNPEGDYQLRRYVGGDCWLNGKLSHNIPLFDKEKTMISSIHSLLDEVEPLSYPVTLFHGFEYYTKYGSNTWKRGDIIQIPGFLSKTLSYNIAFDFAFTHAKLHLQFLIVKYPKESKHIHHNVRPFNNEFEYLTYSNEKLRIDDIFTIVRYPAVLTFYVCYPNVGTK